MTSIRQIAGPDPDDSHVTSEVTNVFRLAREARLRFSLDLHGAAEDREFLTGVMRSDQFWIAEVDGKIAGFIAFANGSINHLYVHPGHQRIGMGRTLLDVAKRSTDLLRLWVFEVNEPAIHFYQSQGFDIVSRTDGADNEAKVPDVLMEWRAGRRI